MGLEQSPVHCRGVPISKLPPLELQQQQVELPASPKWSSCSQGDYIGPLLLYNKRPQI